MVGRCLLVGVGRCRLAVVGCWLFLVGVSCWLFVVTSWLLVIGCCSLLVSRGVFFLFVVCVDYCFCSCV